MSVRSRRHATVTRLHQALVDARRTGDTVDQREIKEALERAESQAGLFDAGFEEVFSIPRPRFA